MIELFDRKDAKFLEIFSKIMIDFIIKPLISIMVQLAKICLCIFSAIEEEYAPKSSGNPSGEKKESAPRDNDTHDHQ